MPLADGTEFAGYTIERLLGTGGMGEVYLVRHPRLPRWEALKILPAGVSADRDYRQRFAREADIAAALWHPNVVAVHDRGETDGQLWITMDYVEGTDAAQLMQNRYPLGMPSRDVFEIVSAIADALNYAHDGNLLHRDVKPANILLTEPRHGARRILLADFGIARAANDANGLTGTNMTVGSVAYAAPEQLTGKTLDGRADQYALACTAFHLFTGGPPFVDSNPAVVIGNHLSSPPPPLERLRTDLPAVDGVLAKAMSKEPYQRFDTCSEFAAALARGGAGSSRPTDETQLAINAPTPAFGGTMPEQPVRSGSGMAATSRRWQLVAGGIGVLLAVGIVAFIGARLAQPDPAPPSASPPRPSYTWPETDSPEAPQPRFTTAPPLTITQPAPAPPVTITQPAPPPRPPPTRDLGLTTPMSYPYCNGQGVVILGSVTTPGLYAAGVQRLLDAYPGSFYLRTDQSCRSLRQVSDEGNPIYAVFQLGGTSEAQVCAAVRGAGGIAYGKWLNNSTDPGYIIPC
jgi:serine/threonine protein kinase, bacterial